MVFVMVTTAADQRGKFRSVKHSIARFVTYLGSNHKLRWLNRVMQDHEARASDLNRKLIFSFFLLFS